MIIPDNLDDEEREYLNQFFVMNCRFCVHRDDDCGGPCDEEEAE